MLLLYGKRNGRVLLKLIKVLTTIVIVVAIFYVVAADVNHGHGPGGHGHDHKSNIPKVYYTIKA